MPLSYRSRQCMNIIRLFSFGGDGRRDSFGSRFICKHRLDIYESSLKSNEYEVSILTRKIIWNSFLDLSLSIPIMNNIFRVRSNNRSRRRRMDLRRRNVQVATELNSTSSSELESIDHNDFSRFVNMPRPVEEDLSLAMNERVLAIQQPSDDEEPIDESPSIYPNSSHTINQAINCLLRFIVDVHLDKHRTDQLLRMIKSIMPSPNKLPNRLSKLLKLLGHCSMFSSKYLCLHCDSLLIRSDAFRYHSSCPNTRCRSFRSALRSNEITEIVTLDIRAALSSIVNRNIELFQKHASLFPEADPINFCMYQQHQQNLRDKERESALGKDRSLLSRKVLLVQHRFVQSHPSIPSRWSSTQMVHHWYGRQNKAYGPVMPQLSNFLHHVANSSET